MFILYLLPICEHKLINYVKKVFKTNKIITTQSTFKYSLLLSSIYKLYYTYNLITQLR